MNFQSPSDDVVLETKESNRDIVQIKQVVPVIGEVQGAPLPSESSSTVAYRIPVELVWKNVNIVTKAKKNFRKILFDVSGVVKSGQFLAIIGASGIYF